MSKPTCPLLTVDAVIHNDEGATLLIRRGHPPFEGSWAFPGGFVDIGESCEHACCREVEEETGLIVEISSLITVLSEPGRDPRGHVVSVVYRCRIVGGELKAGDDAADASWVADPSQLELAFDHAKIVELVR